MLQLEGLHALDPCIRAKAIATEVQNGKLVIAVGQVQLLSRQSNGLSEMGTVLMPGSFPEVQALKCMGMQGRWLTKFELYYL